jgi:DNA-binding MarR family transcriptional regulator
MSAELGPCACTTLRKASRAVTRFYDEMLRPEGLTATQLAVLRAVDREGPVPMSHVAEALVMDRTSLYRAVGPLLRAGDLESVPSEEDGRAKYLRLSRSGRRRLARAGRRWALAQRTMVQEIGADRWPDLSRWLHETAERALSLEPGARRRSSRGAMDDPAQPDGKAHRR